MKLRAPIDEHVRDLLSETIGRQTLQQARNDLDRFLGFDTQTAENREQATETLADYDVPLGAVERARDFYANLLTWLEDRIERYLTAECDGYDQAFGHTNLPDNDLKIPLRDPTEATSDDLTAWAQDADYDRAFCTQLDAIGAAVEDAMDELNPDRTCVCTATGILLRRWVERDHATYFREITLEYSPKDRDDPAYPREQVYTPFVFGISNTVSAP